MISVQCPGRKVRPRIKVNHMTNDSINHAYPMNPQYTLGTEALVNFPAGGQTDVSGRQWVLILRREYMKALYSRPFQT